MIRNSDQDKKKFISIEEIRALYQKSSRTNAVGEVNRNEQSRELTASARFVVKEAKKILSTFPENESSPTEEEILEILQTVEKSQSEELSLRERNAALAAIAASQDHYDILSPLIQNKEVNDIIIRSYKDISIQIGRKNIQTDLKFSDFESYKAFVEGLLKRAGKACTVANPVVDAAIDPSIRASVTHESLSPGDSGPMLTLRISRHSSISLNGLQASEFAPKDLIEYLTKIVYLGCGAVLIGGEVGTGKTTLIRALSSAIEETEAVLVIEDTNEINLNRRFVRTLLTREGNLEGYGKVSPAQAIRAGMRMAMNRVILGEIRDGEAAEAFVDVCASGHPGMSTIHAKSARDIISRMELFLARAQGEVGIDTIRKQIANAISVVVFVGLDQFSRRRRIMSVMEVYNASEGIVQLSPIFTFQNIEGRAAWKRESGVSIFQDLFLESGYRLPHVGAILDYNGERK